VDDESARAVKDKNVQDRIDGYFKNFGYHVDYLVLDSKATECFITSFEFRDEITRSEPYIESIATYVPKNESELKDAMKEHRHYGKLLQPPFKNF
jgi:uncharacterized protein (DUF1697 family)